jgi:hypothetical protein
MQASLVISRRTSHSLSKRSRTVSFPTTTPNLSSKLEDADLFLHMVSHPTKFRIFTQGSQDFIQSIEFIS